MEEQIIEFVREHNFLYDRSNPDYKNIYLRNKTFDELARKLNISAKKLKGRWRTLRDAFYKQLRVESYDSHVSSTKKPWKWTEHLMFLQEAKANTYSSNQAKYSSRRKTNFQFIDSTDDGSTTMDVFNRMQEDNLTLPEAKVVLSRSIDFAFVEEQTSMSPTLERATKVDDCVVEESDESSREVTKHRDVKAGSAVQLFFDSLAKQTEEANITAKQFAQLQMKLLKVFNKEMYDI